MRPIKHAKLGFTLIEVVVSMSVATVLMGGMASAIVIAGRALPDSQSSLSATVNSFLIAEQMVGEMYCAQGFSERTATAIEFTVFDRDNDSNPETIRYAWDGESGDPLTRQYNGGTVVNLIDSVYDFQLGYNLQTATEETAGPVEVHPMHLAVNIAGIDPEPNTGFVVSDATWCAMYFELDPATAPPDATSWNISQVWFRIKATANGPGTGVTAVQLRAADAGGRPTTAVMGEYLVDEDPLDTKFWTSEGWTGINSPSLPVSEGFCVVFKPSSGTETGQIRFQDTTGVPAAAYTTFLRSTDAGASWTASTNEALTQCTIRANVTTGGSVETTRYFLTSINLTIQASAQQSTRVHTGVEVLNKGEVGGG